MIKILEFLTGFYWILIPQFFVETLIHGRGEVFYVWTAGDWSGHEIKCLLADYDIPIFGWGYAFDRFYFRVPRGDADFAYGIMVQAEVGLL